ncbi:hypothetical protein A3D77_01635 [Candidatus Gottesmanbacteria bacterium RIFCSPHIGHO2_02_FULL_39_11]|uniref:DUF86 domain-containing protein n=1 Tax=Candidatus Gottesmanbacteria bacterium RIFCSPHIGHO2_02_FULL_39_11 TaxID=1798382 RepID=A0A1F5ZTB9_9BACT|nr:MAG: hypothetical protein A3D77_01635 [Candidatus Gottesmanbacteria bacterium RIFCSPHIGHO2_02_FULL_39_11]
MKRSIGVYLDDIFQSIRLIEEYTEGLTKKKFLDSIDKQDAVLRRFEIIGEAARHIPLEFRNNHPKIPWKKAVGMRDVMIHGYYEINLDRVWNTIKKDLPKFKEQIEELI